MKTLAAARTLALLGLAAVAAGCGGAAGENVAENPARLAAADPAAVRTAVTKVLEDMYFEVQMPLASPQRIDTLPLVSAYPLEFWRKDTRTAADKYETALHTVRRTVTVLLGGGQGETSVEVIVRRERLSMPQALDAKTANEAYTVFSSSRRSQEIFEEHWGRGATWVDYGRDPALERYILCEVRRRL